MRTVDITLTISSCGPCPYRHTPTFGWGNCTKYRHYKGEKHFNGIMTGDYEENTIPDWCPFLKKTNRKSGRNIELDSEI